MNRYHIYTDSGNYDEFEAESVTDALDQIDVPSSVTDSDTFVEWLDRVGGYGAIEENGEIIAEVKS